MSENGTSAPYETWNRRCEHGSVKQGNVSDRERNEYRRIKESVSFLAKMLLGKRRASPVMGATGSPKGSLRSSRNSSRT
jgi:hypothetical protein